MSKVKEGNFIIKGIEYIKLALEPLIQSDEVATGNDSNVQEYVEKEILPVENTKKIKELEEGTSEVHISLEEENGVVEKAKVSEKQAQIKADEVAKRKTKQKDERQRTIE